MKIERLTREAFAPFGDLISLAGAHHYPINDGTTERFHDLATIDVSDQGGKPLVSLFRGKPRSFPFIRSGARRSSRSPDVPTS
jgi:ureidoglycolate lyase